MIIKNRMFDTSQGTSMSDRIQFVSQGPTPDSAINHDPLFKQWIEMHKDSTRRDARDNADCLEAVFRDSDAADSRGTHKITPAGKKADDVQDAQGDLQAIGYKHHRGDDQTNAAADSKVVALDKALLKKYGKQLTAEGQRAIEEDIAAKTSTANNSKQDIAFERQYLAGDEQELKVLAHGAPDQIEQANKDQLSLRVADRSREMSYMNDNERSLDADADILSQFGSLKIVYSNPHAFVRTGP
jgi:hypothetical protein